MAAAMRSAIDLIGEQRIDASRGESGLDRLIERPARACKFIDCRAKGIELQFAHVAFLRQSIEIAANMRTVAAEIVGKEVGVGETQREDTPQLGHQPVIVESRIAKMAHPVEIVVWHLWHGHLGASGG